MGCTMGVAGVSVAKVFPNESRKVVRLSFGSGVSCNKTNMVLCDIRGYLFQRRYNGTYTQARGH